MRGRVIHGPSGAVGGGREYVDCKVQVPVLQETEQRPQVPTVTRLCARCPETKVTPRTKRSTKFSAEEGVYVEETGVLFIDRRHLRLHEVPVIGAGKGLGCPGVQTGLTLRGFYNSHYNH